MVGCRAAETHIPGFGVHLADRATRPAAETHIPGFVWIAGRLALIGWAPVKAFPVPWP